MSHRSWLTRSFVAVAAAALTVAGVLATTGRGAPEAQAQSQENSCAQYRVCIEKQTIPGSNVEFPFIIQIESVTDSSVQTEVNGALVDESTTVSLSDGEEIGIAFRGEARITEVPVPGWRLVDIKCEGTSDYGYEISGNTVEIYYAIGTRESFIRCIFINQEVRQPLNLGGLFAGQPTPLPTAPPPAAVAPAAPSQVISPPRTGDAGLR